MDYKKAITIFKNWTSGKRYPLYNKATINKALNLSYYYIFYLDPIHKDLDQIESLTDQLDKAIICYFR